MVLSSGKIGAGSQTALFDRCQRLQIGIKHYVNSGAFYQILKIWPAHNLTIKVRFPSGHGYPDGNDA